jgi:arylformamidase
MKIIDITQELFSCSVYPGDTHPSCQQVKTVAKDGYNLTEMALCAHNGTHIDAPCHFIDSADDVSKIPLDVFYGKCTVVSADGAVDAAQMKAFLESCSERLLFKGECLIADEALDLLSKSHVKLIGVEMQSVSNPDAPKPGHMLLLGKGVIPLEGLVLRDVLPGEYLLSAFPLKLDGSDGSPVRAVLIRE